MRGSAKEEGRSADVVEENNAQNRVITIKNGKSLFCITEKEENVCTSEKRRLKQIILI